MRKIYFLISFFVVALSSIAQTRDYSDWFDFGSAHVNQWLWIAPAKLGPNALPVPRMNYGIIQGSNSIEIGADAHFMEGDQTINSFVNIKWNVAPGKVQLEIWGFPTETFNMSNDVRDERQIYYDDNGWETNQGDLWISTYIQLLQDRDNLPDLLANYSHSFSTGVSTRGRFVDASTHYFYLAVGKDFTSESNLFDEFRIGGLFGWYIWQTNKVEMAQDEGPLAEIGIQFKKKNWLYSLEAGGYSGYDAYKFMEKLGYNDPLIYRARIEHQLKKLILKFEYQGGFQDYNYQTFRMSSTFNF